MCLTEADLGEISRLLDAKVADLPESERLAARERIALRIAEEIVVRALTEDSILRKILPPLSCAGVSL